MDITGKSKLVKKRSYLMKYEIYVVSHKKTRMPQEKIYIPLQVGNNKENFEGYLRDNTGENISAKNRNFCELTAQYWVTKNRDADVKGIVHYRRYFSNGENHFFSSIETKYKDIMTEKKLQDLLEFHDVVVPSKRNYYIETSLSHYAHIHHEKDLEVTRDILNEKYPDYVPIFDDVLTKKSAHMFNMFIAKTNIFNSYTEWLFDILFEVEKRIDISEYSDYEKRVFGFISELLLDVWLEKNHINYVEVPVMFMGRQHWVKKGSSFLYRKVKGMFS